MNNIEENFNSKELYEDNIRYTLRKENLKEVFKKEWETCNHIERFEAWADLYYKRFHRLSPGKDDIFRDSNDEENISVCNIWHEIGLAKHDVIMEIIRLKKENVDLNFELSNSMLENRYLKSKLDTTDYREELL